jgi:hypothetical protein
MPLAVVIVERGLVRIAEASVPPIVNNASVCYAIDRHITRHTQVSLPVQRKIVAGYSRAASSYRLVAVDSRCVCPNKTSLATRLRATVAVLAFAMRVLRALAASMRLLREVDAMAR